MVPFYLSRGLDSASLENRSIYVVIAKSPKADMLFRVENHPLTLNVLHIMHGAEVPHTHQVHCRPVFRGRLPSFSPQDMGPPRPGLSARVRIPGSSELGRPAPQPERAHFCRPKRQHQGERS